MRVLLAHCYEGPPPFGKAWIEDWLGRLRQAGLAVDGFNVGLPIRGFRLPWPELDRRWRRGDRELLQLYERIATAVSGYDVLINYGGLNLHPDFLRDLPVKTALAFFDDPESSEDFSRPVANAHDLCLVGNVAELDTYRSWGVNNVAWWPMGFRKDEYDPGLAEPGIRNGWRDVDVALLCERLTHWRRTRVDRFARAFPHGVYRGPGWPQGFLPEIERIPLLQRTRIGINIHNSTGPINLRTFYLPANGVMQLCDNKLHLAQVYELGREVVGYDSIDEAIDLTRYYLAHEDERREIAVAGWRRVLRDYNEVAAFRRVFHALETVAPTDRLERCMPVRIGALLSEQRARTRFARTLHFVGRPLIWPLQNALRLSRGLYRRWLRLRDNILFRFAFPPSGASE